MTKCCSVLDVVELGLPVVEKGLPVSERSWHASVNQLKSYQVLLNLMKVTVVRTWYINDIKDKLI